MSIAKEGESRYITIYSLSSQQDEALYLFEMLIQTCQLILVYA